MFCALRSCVILFHDQIPLIQYFASIAFIYCIVILHQCGLSPALWKDPSKSPVAVPHSWSHLLWIFPLQSHQLYSDHFLSSSLAFPVAPLQSWSFFPLSFPLEKKNDGNIFAFRVTVSFQFCSFWTDVLAKISFVLPFIHVIQLYIYF